MRRVTHSLIVEFKHQPARMAEYRLCTGVSINKYKKPHDADTCAIAGKLFMEENANVASKKTSPPTLRAAVLVGGRAGLCADLS
jgi:hypothetical protein